jgi:hypothetical protein
MTIAKGVKRVVLLEEIERWERGLYLLGVRARVFRTIGDDGQLAVLTEEMERQEQGLDVLRGELEGLGEG